MNGRNYLANHVVAPQIIQGTPSYNVEVSEGQTPPGEFYPAQYLPVTLSENRIAGSGFVLMPGKVVGLDENRRLVPSGMISTIAHNRAVTDAKVVGGPVNDHATTTNWVGAGTTTYTQLSQDLGVVGIDGSFVTTGTDYLTQFGDSQTYAGFKFTTPVGIMRYSALMAPGSDPSNPATFTRHAYDTGGAKAFSRWCYIQVPVVETNDITETVALTGSNTSSGLVVGYGVPAFRIKVYPDGDGITLTKATYTFNKKALPSMFTDPSLLNDTTVEYALVGRTIIFNGTSTGIAGLNTATTVVYTPAIQTPFTCLSIGAATLTNGYGSVSQIFDAIGETVTYNTDSSFALKSNAAYDHASGHMPFGRILDIKSGQNDDLKLVRSYFRDFGLWQEQPGSATDGRNTQLSIVNAPKWIARIAVNFATLDALSDLNARVYALENP